MAKLKLDHPGIGAVLQSGPVAALVRSAAEGIASAVDSTLSDGTVMPVYVNSGTTDRASSSVVIAHPAALRNEAKHGSLMAAAGTSGLEVRGRKK